MKRHREVREGWGVLFTRPDGTQSLAISGGSPWIGSRDQARKFRRELAEVIRHKSRVVKILQSTQVIR